MSWQDAVGRTVGALGYELVDLERSAGGLLRVTIDRIEGQAYADGGLAVTVDDCEAVTRQLQYVLEVEQADYARLEVSSPGLDRPLKSPADYARFAGAPVDLTLKLPLHGRKRYRGTLLAGAEGGWRLMLLPPEPARAATPGKSKPIKAAKTSKTAKAAKTTKAPASATAAAESDQVLDFRFDEVREARLVPVVDFKGRKPQSTAASQPEVGEV